MKKLDKKQKLTLVITVIVLGFIAIANNLEQLKLKDKIKCKTENLTYSLNKDVKLESTVGENISTDYYTLDNSLKFSVSRYGIEYKDSILRDIQKDFEGLGKFGEYNKNELNWLTIQFDDIPLSNGGCFLLETDNSIYYIEANSTKEDVIDIIDSITLNNEIVQDISDVVKSLSVELSMSEREEFIKRTNQSSDVVLTNRLNGLSKDAKLVVHFNKKFDPVDAVKVYSDIKCEDDSLVFTWNEAYETKEGMDIVVKGDANLLLCQDRLDYDILESDWGNASRLYIKVLNEDKIEQSFIIPITFINDIETPITYTSNGKDVEWLSVDGADSYRIYISEVDREGKLGREQGYINEKPKLLATVDKNTNKFSISESNRNHRFYVTAVKSIKEDEVNVSDTEETAEDTKTIESLFSEEVYLENVQEKPLYEGITKNELDFSNVFEYPEIAQIKYVKTSVDQRTELELERVSNNGIYKYPLSVIPHYVMTGSYPSDIGGDIWTEEELQAYEQSRNDNNMSQNTVLNSLINDAKNQVESLYNVKYNEKYINIINFDNEYEKYIGNALMEGQEEISLDGKNKLNDKEFLMKVIDDTLSKNILLNEIRDIRYDGSSNKLIVKYSFKEDRKILDDFIKFSKELYQVNNIDGIIRWVKEFRVGGNVEALINGFETKGYNEESIKTYLLDLILKSNNVSSKVVVGRKADKDYVWNIFKNKDTWYQYDINDDLTSKKVYVTELDIKDLYDTEVDESVKNVWYTDKDLTATNEKDLINIICNRYAEQDRIIIKLSKGFTFEYSDDFGEELVKQLQNFGYSVDEKFSYSVVGNYLMIEK